MHPHSSFLESAVTGAAGRLHRLELSPMREFGRLPGQQLRLTVGSICMGLELNENGEVDVDPAANRDIDIDTERCSYTYSRGYRHRYRNIYKYEYRYFHRYVKT